MRITDIIRKALDVIDGVDNPNEEVEGYTDSDIKRFKQIVDLADDGEHASEYANQPNERIADLEAVTQDAGADSWQGTKDVDDIRGTTTRIHGNN